MSKLFLSLFLLSLLIPVYTHTQEQTPENQEAEIHQTLEQLSLDETLYSLNFMRCRARFRAISENISSGLIDTIVKQLNPNPSIYDYAICETLYITLIHAMSYSKVQIASEGNTELAALFSSCKQPMMTLEEFEQEAAEYFRLLYPHVQHFVDQLQSEELVAIALLDVAPNSIADRLRTFSHNVLYRLVYARAHTLLQDCTTQQQLLFNFQYTPEEFDILIQKSLEEKKS